MNTPSDAANKGILGWIERTGNRLPDPVFLFLYLIVCLILISLVCDALDLYALHPVKVDESGQKLKLDALSLLSGGNVARLWTEMPKTFSHFHPLGYVLVVMLGAGVAERSGLFSTGMRAAVRKAPPSLLTPTLALVAMISNHAADAAYVVLIPLGGVLFASAGRHPIAGIAAAFAGVSGGFSANVTPGQLDALLFGITQEGAAVLDPTYSANIAGNWYFIAALTFLYLPVIWWVTDKIVEPRLGQWTPLDANNDADAAPTSEESASDELSAAQRKGLIWAALACLGVVALWILMTFGPDTPLINEAACPDDKLNAGKCSVQLRYAPLYKSLVGAFFLLFLAAGWAYGKAVGVINNHRDLVSMMSESMKDLGYYLVLAFVAAHFVAMFNWSNLGLISAVHGAAAIENSGLPLPAVLGLIVLFSSIINIFVGSASAKWALLAPVLVPMLMLLGISPEGATAAYRVGDSATNIITPLMVYFPLILIFCRRWKADYGLGSLTATMVPYSVWFMVTGLLLTILWVYLGFDLGPGAPVSFELPK